MSVYDEDSVWRPFDNSGIVCGRIVNDEVCTKQGTHYCNPRAEAVIGFCPRFLVHTAGPYARTPFELEQWQIDEIIRPVFGEVAWSEQWTQYTRRYQIAYVVMARKNGKSALASAMVLYLLVGDGEESSQILGAALDKEQAALVYKPVRRMVELSPVLSKRLKENKAIKQISDEATDSFYRIIAGDAMGELGHNPHGFVLDEVLSQKDRELWDALRTAAGARAQALFIAITTETNDDATFGARVIDNAEKIQEDPQRQPHIFSFVRKVPIDANPFDESEWYKGNPALGTFKSIEDIRKQAEEAKEEPETENAFRQLQLNQRVQQVTRWMPMVRWMQNVAPVDEESLKGRECFSGLDMASVTDLAALCHVFPNEDDTFETIFRFWVPQSVLSTLDKATGGQASVWAREGWLTITHGDWIDYYGDESNDGLSMHDVQNIPHKFAIHPQLKADAEMFDIKLLGYDQHQATATAQYLDLQLKMKVKPIVQGYSLSSALKEMMRVVKAGGYRGLGNPVIKWNADAVEIKRDPKENIMVVRPDRGASKKRIDGIVAFADAIKAKELYEPEDLWTDPFSSVF